MKNHSSDSHYPLRHELDTQRENTFRKFSTRMSVAYEPRNAEHVQADWAPLSSPPPPTPPRRPRRNRRAWLAGLALSAVVVLGVAAESVPPGTPGHPILVNIVA